MMNEKAVNLYWKAIDMWGNNAQMKMFVEEVGEALVAISHCARGRIDDKSVVEEMVDVAIMAEQMALIYGTVEQYNTIREYKLRRLSDRLQ